VFVGVNFLQAQTVQITGTVTGADDGMPVPGASVQIKGTTTGAATDANGKYTLAVPTTASTLIFSFIGYKTQEVAIAGRNVIDVVLESDAMALEEVVVTALGITRAQKTLAYASQEVKAEELNITSDANIKNAIVGKVAGVQIVGQAGSKLGQAGRIRIRGAVSMTTDGDPLYVIDGVPTTDPNIIDMENVASVNVLKGPNATALYGQRAEYGVVMITTKKATKGGVSVEVNSNTTFENVAYLPNYQNEYGQGYLGEAEWRTYAHPAVSIYPEWSVFNGKQFITYTYADESWGPKFDGREYIPWYALWQDSPYFGQTAKWEAQPNNIKDFYETGVTLKNTITLYGQGENHSARISYTNLNQTGILPTSNMKRNMVSAAVQFKPVKKLTVDGTLNFVNSIINGDFDDSYSNQTTGSFNAWFARDVDMAKLRELKDLKTSHGFHANWNTWGLRYMPARGSQLNYGFEKPAFWYNPFFWLENYVNTDYSNKVVGDIKAKFNFTEQLELEAGLSTNVDNYRNRYELPFVISNSASPELYNAWNNGFGNYKSTSVENNYNARLMYKEKFNDFDVMAFLGTTLRTNSYDRMSAEMAIGSKTQGLVLPDVYTYSNTKLPVTASTYLWNKKVFSTYGNLSLGYKGMAYLDAQYRKDWSSALPADKNGYGYPSIGGSFIFTELLEDKSILSFGKIRAGWAQVGNDVGALAINPVYPLSAAPYMGNPQMYTQTRLIDPNIQPSLNTSTEVGFDLNFLNNKIGFNFTYFNETREKEIIPITLSSATGYTSYLTNAGKSKRSGIELTLTGTPVKLKDFAWDITVNYGISKPEILELPEGMESMAAPGGMDDWQFVAVIHELGNRWGQLRGTAIRTDAQGRKVIDSATDTYQIDPGQYLGSVIPDFTGGILNNFSLFNLVNINAAIDFQKGGKFFSLSEMWGQYSGLLEETAIKNDKGFNIRDAVDDGGGVHVVGVDESGNPYDKYVDAYDYYQQFNSNVIASEYIHDASYIKLRDVSVSVNLPKKFIQNTFISSASIGFVARNVWLIAVSKDNVHGWDPSEMSQTWGENAQLPGTRSFGFNVRLTF
jgi:TonB-linked SusC/RagA family outer membrane protein